MINPKEKADCTIETPWWKPNNPSCQKPIDQNMFVIKASQTIAEKINSIDPVPAAFKNMSTKTVAVTVEPMIEDAKPMHLEATVIGITVGVMIVAGLIFGWWIAGKE